MSEDKHFAVIQLPELKWPTSVEVSGNRFRLFVAADITEVSTDLVSQFAAAGLGKGMVYFCAWGRDCERFHDIVDESLSKMKSLAAGGLSGRMPKTQL